MRKDGTDLELRIGAPNLPMAAISEQKRQYSQLDHMDWTRWWNEVNEQASKPDKNIDFHWAEIFPIRTPAVLRAVLVEPKLIGPLCKLSEETWCHMLLHTNHAQIAVAGNKIWT